VKIPFLGQAPFAIDFALPVLEEDGDETQIISFDLAVPLQ
jgi:outer membrane protein assembly factor BamA